MRDPNNPFDPWAGGVRDMGLLDLPDHAERVAASVAQEQQLPEGAGRGRGGQRLRVPSRPPLALGQGGCEGGKTTDADVPFNPSDLPVEPDTVALLFPLSTQSGPRKVDPDRQRRERNRKLRGSGHTGPDLLSPSDDALPAKEQYLSPNDRQQIELELAADIASYQHDPAGYIWYAFPWGQKGGPLEHHRPRRWALEVCASIRAKLVANVGKPGNMWDVVAEAVASGHGIGKSAFIGQLIMWAMSTHEETRGVCTANTDNQLRTKLWPEVMKWHSMAINKHWFECTATKMFHVQHEHSWKIDAVPWSIKNLEAFQGLHNLGKRILLVMEEASGIDNAVYETAEGAMTDEGTEIIWFAVGNPTRAKGRFRECWTKFKELWTCRNIDSRNVEGTNKSRIARWARIYGETSQFFKIRVAGEFADADPSQLVAMEWVAGAKERTFNMVLGDGGPSYLRVSVDVADGGDNDTLITVGRHWSSMSVILLQKAYRFAPSVAPIEAGDEAERLFLQFGGRKGTMDNLVVDAIGVGAGCAGHLIKGGYNVMRFIGGQQSSRPDLWRNRRVQHYLVLRNRFRDGLICLDPMMCEDQEQWDEFDGQITSIKTKPGTERLEDLQSKEELRKERGATDDWTSPDRADSLMMQFADAAPALIPGLMPVVDRIIVVGRGSAASAMQEMYSG